VLDIVQKDWTWFKKFGPFRKLFDLLVSQAGYGPGPVCSAFCCKWLFSPWKKGFKSFYLQTYIDYYTSYI